MNKQDEIEFNTTYDDVDITAIVMFLWNRKLNILLITFFVTFLSVAVSFLLPNYYKSTTLVEVVAKSSQGPSLSSGMSSLASIAGISVPSSGSANKTAFIIATLESREFIHNLLKYDEVLPSLMAAKSFDHSSSKIIFDPKLYNNETQKWVRKPSYPYKSVPSILEVHKELNDGILSASVDKKTGYIFISVEHLSPVFAESLLNIVINELNKVARDKDLKDSQEAINYLKSEAIKSSSIPLNNSISRLIEAKIETQMMAQIHEDYLLSFIDPPFYPEKKSWPRRTSILIAMFIISLFTSIFSYLLLYFSQSLRGKL
jgi:hypothetical protein